MISSIWQNISLAPFQIQFFVSYRLWLSVIWYTSNSLVTTITGRYYKCLLTGELMFIFQIISHWLESAVNGSFHWYYKLFLMPSVYVAIKMWPVIGAIIVPFPYNLHGSFSKISNTLKIWTPRIIAKNNFPNGSKMLNSRVFHEHIEVLWTHRS